MRISVKLTFTALIFASLFTACATSPSTAPLTNAAIEAVNPVHRLEEGSSRWWAKRHQEKLARIRQGDIDLLMIGDSITHSWELSGKPVFDRYYSHRKPANIGYSGDRTEHVIWRLQNGEVDGIAPKLAVLMIGTNNTGHRQDAPEDIALGIKHIIGELRTRLPNTKILLLAIFPRGATIDDPLRVINDQTNALIANYADNKHVFFLNINDHFLDNEGSLPESIMPDLLHPNAKGYALWAKAMEPMIAELMN